jgi:hypothetical protein
LNSQTLSGSVSGRITGIAAHPANASLVDVATAGGGVWSTSDGGTTWTPLTDGQRSLSINPAAVPIQEAAVGIEGRRVMISMRRG